MSVCLSVRMYICMYMQPVVFERKSAGGETFLFVRFCLVGFVVLAVVVVVAHIDQITSMFVMLCVHTGMNLRPTPPSLLFLSVCLSV